MKKFISGLLAGFILSTATTAFAIGETNVTAIMGKVGIKVNNVPITEETLLYNGTTYVPLRAISTILGADVDYDAGTRTALIFSENFGVAPLPENYKKTTSTTSTANTNETASKRITKAEYEDRKAEIENTYESTLSDLRKTWQDVQYAYTTGEKIFKAQDLTEQIAKLKEEERSFANAVTLTGQNHHDQIVQQIKQYEGLQAAYEYDWNNIKAQYKEAEATYKQRKQEAEDKKNADLAALEKEYKK